MLFNFLKHSSAIAAKEEGSHGSDDWPPPLGEDKRGKKGRRLVSRSRIESPADRKQASDSFFVLSLFEVVSEVMEDPGPRSPLLTANAGRRSGRSLRRRNSVNTLRTEFVEKLPEKIRSGLDVESGSCDIDFARTRGLSKGLLVRIA